MNKMTKEVNVLRNRLAVMTVADVRRFVIKINDDDMKSRVWCAYRTILSTRAHDAAELSVLQGQLCALNYRHSNWS